MTDDGHFSWFCKMAIRRFAKSPRNAKKGFSLIEIVTVVGVIGALVAIAIPNFVSYRKSTQAKVCLGNMKQIQSAAEQCKIVGKEATAENIYGSDKYIKIAPKCPLDRTKDYVITTEADGRVKIECPNNPGGQFPHALPEDLAEN